MKSKVLGLIAVELLACPAVFAAPIPDAILQSQGYVAYENVGIGSSWLSNTAGDNAVQYGTVDTYFGTGAYISGWSTLSSYFVDGTGYISAFASATDHIISAFTGSISYSVEVVGPSNVNVPLDFSALGQTNNAPPAPYYGSGIAEAFASFNDVSLRACTGFGDYSSSCVSASNYFSGTYGTNVTSNQIYNVYLQVLGVAETSSSVGALIDPMIAIDPSFTLPGYSLLISADQPAPVPEPATLSLVVLCLAGIGFARRRKVA